MLQRRTRSRIPSGTVVPPSPDFTNAWSSSAGAGAATFAVVCESTLSASLLTPFARIGLRVN